MKKCKHVSSDTHRFKSRLRRSGHTSEPIGLMTHRKDEYESRSFGKTSGCRHSGDAIKRTFLLKRFFLYPCCFLSVYVLSDAFLPVFWLRILLALGLSLFPFFSVINLLYARRTSYLRSQSKVLLQSLCTSVSAGYSLESAFMCARPTVEKAFGKRSILVSALKHVEKSLSAQEPLSDVAVELCYRMDYVELLPVMHALSITRVIGTGVISILKNSCQMMSELIAVKNEVEANNAGKNAEAFLLCLMPFGITYALSSFTGDYMSSARNDPLGIGLMLLSFSIAIISCGFLFAMIGEKSKGKASAYSTDRIIPPRFKKVTGFLRGKSTRFLPQGYLTRVYELMSELTCTPDELFEALLLKSMVVSIIVLPVVIFILNALSYPFLLSIPIVAFSVILIHRDLRSRVFLRREGIMEEIPLFLSMLVTLLQSGVLLPKAIETCTCAFSDTSVMGQELRIIQSQMLSGMSAGRALELFSERTPVPEAQSALLLASRHEITGGSEVLGLLSLQSTACWALCRNASRKKREREALAMILPMMLDFISVLLVATTPALISLQLS
ncbi:MAG: hypothetical protein GX099_02150 [Clostridiaceae bacterium]|nr:hypothetical protein [Clostridiaceae bacterium]